MQRAFSKLTRAREHLETLRTSILDYRATDGITSAARPRDDPLDLTTVILEYVVRDLDAAAVRTVGA